MICSNVAQQYMTKIRIWNLFIFTKRPELFLGHASIYWNPIPITFSIHFGNAVHMPTSSAHNFIQHKWGHWLCYAKRLSQLTQILVSWANAMWKLSRHSQVSLWDSEHSSLCAAVLINREIKAVILLLQGWLICSVCCHSRGDLEKSWRPAFPCSLLWCMK